MTQQKELTLDEAKRLYASTGFCEHSFPTDPFEIPKCNIMIVQCKVCAHELNRYYKD